MAVSPFLYRLAWGGSLYTLDTWSCSLMLHGPDILTDAEPFVPALTAYHTSAGASIPSRAQLEFVKFNVIDPLTGKYASNELSVTHDLPTGVNGGQANFSPSQLTCCVSVLTDFTRGRGHAGRFYPPYAQGTGTSHFDTSGRISATDRDLAIAAAKTLLDSINALTTAKLVIFSKLAQTITPVTGVSVGRVIDTQRRRRSSLIEEAVRQELA